MSDVEFRDLIKKQIGIDKNTLSPWTTGESMRIVQAFPGMREAVTEAEINKFLENSKLTEIQIVIGMFEHHPIMFLNLALP